MSFVIDLADLFRIIFDVDDECIDKRKNPLPKKGADFLYCKNG